MTVRSAALQAADLEPPAAFLGRRAPAGPAGSPPAAVPPCWHWCLLLDPVDPRGLDDNGYEIGSPLTPEAGMTRMFAGGRVTTTAPLEVGVSTTRRTRVSRTVDKQGRRGPLRFITLESTWSQRGNTCLVDEQDYVFMPASPPASPRPTTIPGPAPHSAPSTGRGFTDETRSIQVTEPMLVAFSGLTANPYRIHWDRDFCARNGHDGLVIHGPLQALWLAEEFTRRGADFTGRTFLYRLSATATAPAVMTVAEGQKGTLEVRRPDGTVTATAAFG